MNVKTGFLLNKGWIKKSPNLSEDVMESWVGSSSARLRSLAGKWGPWIEPMIFLLKNGDVIPAIAMLIYQKGYMGKSE